METTNTNRGVALLAGCIAVGAALAILLQDAIRSGDWQLEHGLIPALIVLQIITAHLVGTALRMQKYGSAFGFAIIALLGTWGILYTSVSKQAGATATVSAVSNDVAARRSELLISLDANSEMLNAARVRMGAECASGQGPKCRGVQATEKVYADAVAGVEAKLAALGPPKPDVTKADKMAELLALALGRDEAGIRHVLLLLEPFMFATIFELGALISFGFAFSPRRKAGNDNVPTRSDSYQTDFDPGPGTVLPETVAIEDPSNVVSIWTRKFEGRHGRRPSIPELQQAFPEIPRTSVWRYSKAA